jgi:outer membrane lipoprotein-sorting protein
MKKNVKRWMPAAVVPVAIVAAAIAVPSAADAAPNLPTLTAQQVLERIAASDASVYSGTIEQTSALGLPDVSALGSSSGDDAASALELLTGSHEARVFVGGDDKQRVQVLDDLAERDVVRNGDSVWLYDSSEKTAAHLTASGFEAPATTSTVTPAEAATKLLAAVDPTTTVEVVDTARVAGRPVYRLELTPRDSDTLVGTVALSVDSETGLPLGASITAKGETDPAFSVEFSKISFTAPDASLFEFTPPSDATVTEKTVSADDITDGGLSKGGPDAAAIPPTEEPTVVGEGWDAVVVIPDAGEALADPMVQQLTTAVDGGRVLSTSLLTVLLTDDGRVLVGAVGTAQLQAAAGQ